MTNNSNPSKQDLILHAASSIVQRDGMAQLTLEAVAKEAGVSKGGLLYHFSSKEALIKGMVDKLNEAYGNDIRRKALEDQNSKGSWSRAYVESAFHELEDGLEMSSALFAAAFANPKLLEGLQEQYKNWQSHIQNDGTDPVRATIARLAADGLWFAEMFGLAPLDNDLRNDVYNELISWTREGD
jgi:AcrR family transcriptional regulator